LNFNLETIEKLIHNEFEIDCIDICLTQQIENAPIVIRGPGTIYQDEDGMLQLKLYSNKVDHKKEIPHLLKYHKPGKIIDEDNYFTLKAIDMLGTEWNTDNVRISRNVSFPTNSQVIRSSIKEIKTIENKSTSDKNYIFMIIPGDYQIPCNEKEDFPNGGSSFNGSVFTINNVSFKFKKLDKCLTINASSTSDCLKGDTYIKIIEALSIITGFVVRPVVVKHPQQNDKILKIRSVPNSFANNRFMSPFDHSRPVHMISFSSFMGKYLKNIEAPFSDLYGFWHKINRAWQADVENSSLSLSVAIEGMTKSYFEQLGMPEDEIAQQASDAKQKIKNLGLGSRIKDRLLSSIGSLLNNPSAKGALYQMVQAGSLSKRVVDQWVKLRNKSVHPDKLNEDPREFQKYLDQIFNSIALFYCLLFTVIKYEGSYIDYSEDGWPEKFFPKDGK